MEYENLTKKELISRVQKLENENSEFKATQKSKFEEAGVGVDTSNLKKVEESLRKSTQSLETSQRIARVGGWELDLATNNLFWTAETYRIHDTCPEEFNPTVDAGVSYFLPESKRIISEALKVAIEQGEGYDLELETLTTKGRLINVRTTCDVTLHEGMPVKLTGIFQDITDLKNAEQSLINSEHRFNLAMQGANDGLFDWDLKNNTIYFSPRWKEMIGYKVEEINNVFESWLRLVHVDDLDEVIMKGEKFKFGDDLNYESEFRMKHKNGSYRNILSRAFGVRSKEGNLLRVVGTHVDITKLKTAEIEIIKLNEGLEKRVKERTHELEQSLRENAKFSEAIEQSHTTVIITDKKGNIEYVNPNFERTTGYKFEEIKNKNSGLLQSGEMSDLFYKEIWDTIIAGKIWQGEFITKKKNNEHFWESAVISPIFDKNREITNFVVVKKDITERKKADEELKLFKLFTDNSSEGFGIMDLSGKSIYSNKKLAQLVELNEIPLNEPVINFYSKEDKEFVQSTIESELQIKGKWEGELNFLTAKGNILPVYQYIFHILDGDGQPISVATIVLDYTKRKQIESELKESMEVAKNANRAKSVFLANMSHEIRTPMNAILGFSEILSNRIKDQSHLDYLASIQSSGKTLLELINDILDLSKIESGKLKFNFESCNINGLIQDTIRMLKIKSDQKELSLNTIISKDLPNVVKIDELRVKQILINLINNSIKFTHKGYVEIEMSCQNKTTNSLDLVLKVKDTGIGISEENHQNIFQAFHQIEDFDSKRFEGTGLGLAITNQLVKLMNGTIELESEVGKGSVFTVVLNKVKYSDKQVELIESTNADRDLLIFEEATILIVDDLKSNREVIKGYLEGLNLNIVEAENGEEALTAIKQNIPNLVFLDLRMPVMDGFETIEIIMKNPKWSNIPVIAITASTFVKDEKQVIASGFSDYVRKPISFSEILELTKKHLKYRLIYKDKEISTELTVEIPDNLKEIILEIEEKAVPVWNKIEELRSRKKVVLLANILVETGQNFNANMVSNYGNELLSACELFNINKEMKLIKDFPVFFKELKNLNNEK